jgi:hypothetical protein
LPRCVKWRRSCCANSMADADPRNQFQWRSREIWQKASMRGRLLAVHWQLLYSYWLSAAETGSWNATSSTAITGWGNSRGFHRLANITFTLPASCPCKSLMGCKIKILYCLWAVCKFGLPVTLVPAVWGTSQSSSAKWWMFVRSQQLLATYGVFIPSMQRHYRSVMLLLNTTILCVQNELHEICANEQSYGESII